MPGRREQHEVLRTRVRWVAGVTALGVTGTAVAIALLPAASASAKTPKADYHAGSDNAVFTVTGVEDSNCLVSVGGSSVYIKPGDRVDFTTGLAGVALDGLDLQGGQIAGLNVKVKLDGGAKKGGQSFTVDGGKTVKISGLSNGTHRMSWTATGITVAIPQTVKTTTKKVLGPLGGLITKVIKTVVPAHNLVLPLSSSELKSGASLSWTGAVYVTKNAAQCKLSVQTPTTKVSVGPVKVTVPGQKVTVPGVGVPTKGSGVPSLGSSSSPTSSSPSSSASYEPPVESVPQMVVPTGDNDVVYGGGGGYHLGVSPDNGSSTKLASGNGSSGSSSSSSGTSGSTTSGSGASSSGGAKTRTVDLAADTSSSSVSSELPVILAILAVVALAIVAGTYARLFLLGRSKN